jgi:hypothetical protein
MGSKVNSRSAQDVRPSEAGTRLTLPSLASNLRGAAWPRRRGCLKERPMGHFDGGFWAAIITWTVLAIVAALTGLGLHIREKGQSK